MAFLTSPSKTAVQWQSLLGNLTSQQRFIYLGRLFNRPIQWFLQVHWTQGVDSQDQVIRFPDHLRPYLEWWMERIQDPEGRPLIEPDFDVRVHTDASKEGWGGHTVDQMVRGRWEPEEVSLHINVLEMRGLINTLCELSPPEGTVILASVDNSTVVAYINRQGGTHSWDLMNETWKLYQLVQERNWTIRNIRLWENCSSQEVSDYSGIMLPEDYHHKLERPFQLYHTLREKRGMLWPGRHLPALHPAKDCRVAVLLLGS